MYFEKKFVGIQGFGDEDHDFFLINATMNDVENAYLNYDPTLDTVLDGPVSSITPTLDLDGPLTYRSDYPHPDAHHINITGTKTDALGTTSFPAGTESGYDISYQKVLHLLETDGYWTTSEGQHYMVIDVFVSDRLTGDVFVEKHPVYIADDVDLGNEFFAYRDAKDNGEQDIVEVDGVLYAGDIELGVSKPAVPWVHLNDQGDTPTSETTMSMTAGEDLMSALAIEPSEEDHQMHDDAMVEMDELVLL